MIVTVSMYPVFANYIKQVLTDPKGEIDNNMRCDKKQW